MSVSAANKPSVAKRLVCALAVAAVLLAALVVTSKITIPKVNDSEFGLFDPARASISGEPDNSIDVVVVGDSLVLNGLAPLQTWHENGYTMFVCSSLAQKLPDGYTMLRDAFKNQRPTLVLIEAHPVFASFTWNYALMSEAQNALPVLRYHGRWRSLSLADFTSQRQNTWRDKRKGIRIELDSVAADEEDAEEYMEETAEEEDIAPQNELYLRRMVDACRAVGATPVLVSMPGMANWSMAHHNALEDWAAKMGIDYYDFNQVIDEIGLDWDVDSKDGGEHLNLSGASKFSRYLATVLTKNYQLPDHRDDPAYASWEELYQAA